MTTPDYGSDGFDPWAAEADSDPGVVLEQPVLETEEPVDGTLPLEVREQYVNEKTAILEQAVEAQETRKGMEQFYIAHLKNKAIELAQQGLPPKQIEKIALDFAKEKVVAASHEILQKRTAQNLAAREFGLDPSVFRDQWTIEEMRERAAQIRQLQTPEGQAMMQNYLAMQQSQQQLQQNGVPFQNFNRPGRSGGSNSPAELRRKYANGEIPNSPAVQKAIFG